MMLMLLMMRAKCQGHLLNFVSAGGLGSLSECVSECACVPSPAGSKVSSALDDYTANRFSSHSTYGGGPGICLDNIGPWGSFSSQVIENCVDF